MQKQVTANSADGRAIGALFFAGFGVLWMVLALYAKQWLAVGPVVVLACGAAVLGAGAFWLLRRSRTLPR